MNHFLQFVFPIAAAVSVVWLLLRGIKSDDLVMTTIGVMVAVSVGTGGYFLFREHDQTAKASYALRSGDTYAFQGHAGGEDLLTVRTATPSCGPLAEKVGARFLSSVGAVASVANVYSHSMTTIEAKSTIMSGNRRDCVLTLTGGTDDAARVFRQGKLVHASSRS